MEGKVALITGGASGVGERTARLFCRRGAKVVVADVQESLGMALCKDIPGGAAAFVHCDVTDEASVRDAVDFAARTHGRLDVMVNNAAVIGKHKVPLVESERADFERTLAVNLVGVFLGTKHAARVMIPAGKGSIVNTGSLCAVLGGAGPHAYTAAKHAVVGLTKNAATELGRLGIRVNCMSPSAMATPMLERYLDMKGEELERAAAAVGTLKGAVLTAEDAAEAVAFLASDAAKYVNGHNLVVDGGFSVQNTSADLPSH